MIAKYITFLCGLLLGFQSLAADQAPSPLGVDNCYKGSHALDELARRFNEPERHARPWVYWFWMNGNISKEGITADLEAMHAVGIGGVMMFNVSIVPEGPIHYQSPEWMAMVRHATKTAKELDISFVIHNCAGWATSGGPWVTKDNAMKKLVFSEVQVSGGKSCNQALPMPEKQLDYYRDIACLAFPAPAKKQRVPDIAGKAGFERQFGLTIGSETVSAEAIVPSSAIIDLSDQVSEQGVLSWDAPAGENWTVLRVGYTLTGRRNTTGIRDGIGLECDKMSCEAVDAHWRHAIQPIVESLGDGALNGVLFDSYEAKSSTWTAKMPDEFRTRRGYDLLKWLPVLTGRYVDSVYDTEAFLWDFRRTIADLYEDHYYHHAARLAGEHGLEFYLEPYEGPFDSLRVGATAHAVMGECWTNGSMIHWNKVASSVAHTYGIRRVGCEIFTADGFHGRWQGHPRNLKRIGDRVWSEGVNHFVIHRYAHQPWMNVRPGQSLGPYGTHFERTNPWWNPSREWITYLTRAQQVLQAGRAVADIALVADEGMPSHGTWRPDIKELGYDYDMVSASQVPQFRYHNGEFILPSGATYKALIFSGSAHLTLHTLEKIKELTDAGATVFAPLPLASPSRSDLGAREKYAALVGELFDRDPAIGASDSRAGRVISREDIGAAIKALDLLPDFEVRDPQAEIAWVHRELDGAQIYFLANQMNEPVNMECTFRPGAGYAAEIWKPESGAMFSIGCAGAGDGRARLDLNFESEEAYFVVFRKRTHPAREEYLAIRRTEGLSERPAAPLPKLEIESAQFGIIKIEHPHLVDVTGIIRKKVLKNGLAIQSGNQLGGDPAPGNGKTLWVEYRQDGKIQNAFAREQEMLNIAPSSQSLEILRALYGLLPEELSVLPRHQARDITGSIRGLVHDGCLRLIPGDHFEVPDDGVPRQVRIAYRQNGESGELTVGMEETVVLPVMAWRYRHPFPELRYRDGKPFARVWEAGAYHLTSGSGKETTLDIGNVPQEERIDGPWNVYFPPSGGDSDIKKDGDHLVFDTLTSFTRHPDGKIRYFSGSATYSREVHIDANRFDDGLEIWLNLGRVECIAEVALNGKPVAILWKEPYRVNITGLVTPGPNRLEVKVTNTLANRLIGDAHGQDEQEYQSNGIITTYPDWLKKVNPAKSSSGKTFSVVKLWNSDDELTEAGLQGPVTLQFSRSIQLDSAPPSKQACCHKVPQPQQGSYP
ncbi:glycosyl hydrolase [Pontiella desulfatans]|nr:glycosyl hydrolase [Pontiella desulfatans]